MLREWRKEKQDLKYRTIQMLEQTVQDQSAKLKHDFEQAQL